MSVAYHKQTSLILLMTVEALSNSWVFTVGKLEAQSGEFAGQAVR